MLFLGQEGKLKSKYKELGVEEDKKQMLKNDEKLNLHSRTKDKKDRITLYRN